MAEAVLPKSEKPPLIYGSALNMLLFSKSYNKNIHKKILNLMQARQTNTLFTISDNVFEQQAAEWEEISDNLLYSHGTGIMHLVLKVMKLKGQTVNSGEIQIPLKEEELYEIRKEAEKARKKIIPLVRKI